MDEPWRRTYERGIEALENGDAESAAHLLRSALEAGGSDEATVRLALGEALLAVDSEAAARDEYLRAYEGRADLDPGLWLDLVDGLEGSGFFDSDDEAKRRMADAMLADVDDLAEAEPDNATVFVVRGSLLQSLGWHHVALDEFLYAAELDEDNADAWFGAAESQEALGLVEEAAESLDEVARLYEDDPDLLCQVGWLRIEAEDAPGAVEAFEQALDLDPNWTDAYMGRGRASAILDLPEEAASDFAAVVERERDNTDAWAYLGLAQYDIGDDRGAIEAFTRALDLDATHNQALKRRADAFWQQGDLAAAEADYARAVGAHPEDLDARIGLAEVRLARGETAEALADAEAVLSRDPSQADAAVVRVTVLRDAGDADAALAAATIGLENSPGDPDLYVARALVHRARGSLHLALRDLTWAVETEPSGEAYRARGRLALDLGAPEDAAADFTSALQIDPEDMEALAWRGRAAQLNGVMGEAEKDWIDVEEAATADDPAMRQIEAWRNEVRRY